MSPPESADRLRAAARALATDRPLEALDQLLAAWAAHRIAETAERIEALGQTLDRSLPPLQGSLRKAPGRIAWIALAAKRRPADIGRLLASLPDATAVALREVLPHLAGFPPDPRIPLPVLRSACRFTSTGAGPARTRARTLARDIADGRILDHLPTLYNTAALRTLSHPPRATPEELEALDALDPLLETLAAAPAPSEDELWRSGEAGGGDDEIDPGLWRATLEDPDDDAKRLVLADRLQERGDPRGVVIALQCKEATEGLTPSERDRVQALIDRHASSWLRPIAEVVRNPVFRRGFLAKTDVSFPRGQAGALGTHPLWETVEEIDECNDEQFLLSPALRSLKRVRCATLTLAELASIAHPPALEHVTLAFSYPPGSTPNPMRRRFAIDPIARVARSPFPLQRLGLDPFRSWLNGPRAVPRAFDWILPTPLFATVRELQLFTYKNGAPIAEWLDWLGRTPSVARFRLTLCTGNPRGTADGVSTPRFHFDLERRDAGFAFTATALTSTDPASFSGAIGQCIARLSSARLPAATVRHTQPDDSPKPDHRRGLATQLKDAFETIEIA